MHGFSPRKVAELNLMKMEKTMKYNFLISALSLSCYILTGCALNAPKNDSVTVNKTKTISVKGISDPSSIKYLGDGINVMGTDPMNTYKKNAVEITDAWRIVGGQEFKSQFKTVINTSDITTFIHLKGSASADFSLFDIISLKPSVSVDLSNKIHLSANTISMIATVEYEYGVVMANSVQIKPSVYTDPLCQETMDGIKFFSPELFRKQYGDGFVSKARLGERLYIVYECTIKDTTINTAQDVKAAMEAKFLKIFGGNVDVATQTTSDIILSNTIRKGYIYSTGGFINTEFADNETAIKNAYTEFAKYVNTKIASPSTSEFSIIEANISSYKDYLTNYQAIDEYMKKILAWQELLNKIETVSLRSFTYDVIQNCTVAIGNIKKEMMKCRTNDVTSRYPVSDEYASLCNVWEQVISTPTYRAFGGDKKWTKWVKDGVTAGTTNQSRRLEAVQISLPLEADPLWSITYSVYGHNTGWYDWVSDGSLAGTTNQSRQIEAMRILLKGMPTNYHVKYRAWVNTVGWLPWVTDGAVTGSTTRGERIEAIQVAVLNQEYRVTNQLITGAVPSGLFKIVSKLSGKSLSVVGASLIDKAKIEQRDYVNGDYQRWIILDKEGDGITKIISLNSLRALDDPSSSTINGTIIQQFAYHFDSNQQWKIISNGDGTYKILNRYSGKALSIVNKSIADGALIEQRDYSGADSQKWILTKLD